MPHFDALKIYAVENIVRKGEIACYEHFLLFSQCFLPYGTYFSFYMQFKMSSAICFNLDQSKILSSGNGLSHLNVKIWNITMKPVNHTQIAFFIVRQLKNWTPEIVTCIRLYDPFSAIYRQKSDW